MIPKRRILFITVILLLIFVTITNYFMNVLINTESEVRRSKLTIEDQILQKLPLLNENYKTRQISSDPVVETFISNLKSLANGKTKEELWKLANLWVSKTQLYNYNSSYLGSVLSALKTSKIIKADIDTRGTQLKLLLTLEGNQQAVFKPKWYSIDKIIEGPVYAGKDRYGSEILGFYLSAFLEKHLTPITTERKLSLKNEIVPVATERLLKTIFEHKSVSCVYGKCFYCKREDPVCEDTNGMLTGAIIFNLDRDFVNNRSPWQRTYKKGKAAIWETSNDYCRNVKTKVSNQRLLDLVDVAIFDFLIQNGDRHHYETLDNKVIWIDNGKGLGNPNIHHVDILAPLYQCCMLRSSTWRRLTQLSGGVLKEKLKTMPDIKNFVSDDHLKAIEERLLIIYAAVEYCRTRNKVEHNIF